MRVGFRTLVCTLAAAMLAACAGGGAPTAEELQEALLTPDDLGAGWAVEYSGPLTDEMRAEGDGGIDLCPEAESIVAPITAGRTPSGDWQADLDAALSELDMQVVYLTLPTDRTDAQPVSLGQTLHVGETDRVRTIYTGLSEAYRRCLKVPPDPDSNWVGTELTLPEVGSERFGWMLQMGDEDRWDIRWVLVRDGDVLMNIVENEILSGESILSDEQFAEIVFKAVDELP